VNCSVIVIFSVYTCGIFVFVGASQAKQNYERELLLHATDIESLSQVKQEASNDIWL